VGVEKGTKAVISANSSVYGGLEFNNLRIEFRCRNSRNRVFQQPRDFSPTEALSDFKAHHIYLQCGMGRAANNMRHGFAIQRAQRTERVTRALSIAIPVFAYICR